MKPTNGFLPARLPITHSSMYNAASFLIFFMIFQSCQKDFTKKDFTDDQLQTNSDGHRSKPVDLKLIADNLTAPLGVVTTGEEDDKRLFIIDQIGKIWIIDRTGNRLAAPFLDISRKLITLNPNSDERGLLGLAFHPKYKRNGKFYVYYQTLPRPGGPAPGALWNNLSRVSEFRVSGSDKNLADVNSERPVLEIDDPQGNHNGGTIAFGPKDDYLYIAIGDGGGANDINLGHVADWYLPNAGGNGQDIESNLFGNILRIDVDGGMPYGIPTSNPFVGKPGLDEVYAYGLRNPYRFSFDMKGNNDLIVGDVGQLMFEEINVIKKGGNYGWNVKEGISCFNAAGSTNPFPSCPTVDNFGNPLVDPVIVQNNFRNPAGGKSIAVIGGNVYRGSDIDGFKGKYLFGSYSQSQTTRSGELFIAKPMSNGQWSYEEVVLKSYPNDLGMLLKGFGQDRKGEVYLTTSSIFGPTGNTGKIFKLVEVDDDDHDDDDDQHHDGDDDDD
ncbi:MAG: PQQ-dependent sugar dehydrogenase [Chitinophagaceae bacterium]